MAIRHINLSVLAMLFFAGLLGNGCSSRSLDQQVTDPIKLPKVPELTTLVVPDELQDEFEQLNSIPYDHWTSTDAASLSWDLRRASVYWRFSFRSAESDEFWIEVFATDRKAARHFVDRVCAGWGMSVIDSYYTAADQRAHYKLQWDTLPSFYNLAQVVWLAGWLLENYPDYVADYKAYLGHNEGFGGDF